jgi:hypothetical protein
MFDPSKYGNDPEQIIKAVEAGEVTADEAVGIGVCFTCKRTRLATELNRCKVCGEGYCDTCPPFCDCIVRSNLATLSAS